MSNVDLNSVDPIIILKSGYVWEVTPKFRVVGGQLYAEGSLSGITVADGYPVGDPDYPQGKPVVVEVFGVVELQLDTGVDNVAVGDPLYIVAADLTEGKLPLLTKTAKGNTLVGYAVEAAQNVTKGQYIRVQLKGFAS